MGIIEFILICAVLGFVAWLLITYVPMPAPIQTIIIIAVCIVIIVLLLNALGIMGYDRPIPRLR